MSDRARMVKIEVLLQRIEDARIGTLGAHETIDAIRAILEGALDGEDVDLGALDDFA